MATKKKYDMELNYNEGDVVLRADIKNYATERETIILALILKLFDSVLDFRQQQRIIQYLNSRYSPTAKNPEA